EDHKPNIVPGSLIFSPGVAEASDEANRSFVHNHRDTKVPLTLISGNYFFASLAGAAAAFPGAAAGAAPPSGVSFFSVITSGPAAASTAGVGSSSTVGASTENTVSSGETRVFTPSGSGISRT